MQILCTGELAAGKESLIMAIISVAGELILRFMHKMSRDRVRAHSAEAAFFIIMSFFPFLMLMLTLVQFTPITQEQVLYTIEDITPMGLSELLEPIVHTIYNQPIAVISWTAIAALWSAGKAIMGLADGLNSVYGIQKTKNYLFARLHAAFYVILMILSLIVSLAILVFGYSIREYLRSRFPVADKYLGDMFLVPMLIALLILIVLFTVLYAFLPDRRQRLAGQIPGAVFSAISWAAYSYGFSLYLDFAGSMSVIYGSLTTLVVVMLWLYGSMYLLFIGAEINLYIAQPERFPLPRREEL